MERASDGKQYPDREYWLIDIFACPAIFKIAARAATHNAIEFALAWGRVRPYSWLIRFLVFD